MNTLDDTKIPDELLAKIQKAAAGATKGRRDPKAMKDAAERMDRLREEIFRRNGLMDIGVPAIRELRDGA
jgi:hypothetical protein